MYEILCLSLLGILAGETTYTGIEEYGRLHRDDLARCFEIHGIPSHDTIRLLFERLLPEQFLSLFQGLLEKVFPRSQARDVISLDGKTIRNSGRRLLHIVSAWSSENRLILAHQKTQGKGTELQGLKDILEGLDIQGHVVTTDALGCQKEMTEKIVAQGGDYLLQVKGNQKNLLEMVRPYLEDPELSFKSTLTDKKRGWVHTVTTTLCQDISFLKETCPGWEGIQAVLKVSQSRSKGDKRLQEERFYIASFCRSPEEMQQMITQHWGIENNVHWVLDVRFNEDKSCIRSENAAENMNLIKKIAMNILYTLQKEEPKKPTLKSLQRRFTKPSAAKACLQNCLKFVNA